MVKRDNQWRKIRYILADKINMISLVCFILSLFLLDVSANNIGAYGINIQENFIRGIKFQATSTFWFGFLAAGFFFFLVSIRSLYLKRRYPSMLDLFFGIVGIIGLMMTLSGGLLIFWHANDLAIPFFSIALTRISFYHIGIGLDLIAMFYFALTK